MAWKANVLVVANVTAGSDELLEALRRRSEQGPAKYTLLVPARGSGEAAREAAARNLAAALERLEEAGLEASGTVGDSDPLVAVKEVWDPASFDEVVVATLPSHASRWLLGDLPHRIERLTGAQVTHVEASPPKRAPEPVHVERKSRDLGVLTPLAALGWSSEEEIPSETR
jgi:hypothetical protein